MRGNEGVARDIKDQSWKSVATLLSLGDFSTLVSRRFETTDAKNRMSFRMDSRAGMKPLPRAIKFARACDLFCECLHEILF